MGYSQAGLELLISCTHLSNARIVGVHYYIWLKKVKNEIFTLQQS